ncbi:4a-hydroxytetrahydrobiopterin dehydratase [Embleya hyalina]|uniref:4a-hydroxytetrahydrobiopterin dehydratase n=1 Tax=Embleya hyalina TaxID=516124 RepID=UPI003530E423
MIARRVSNPGGPRFTQRDTTRRSGERRVPPHPLTEAELAETVAGLPDWTYEHSRLTSTFRLPRPSVTPFLAAVAKAEDAANHHAVITLLYDKVSLALQTHDADNSVTVRDVALAREISLLARQHGSH